MANPSLHSKGEASTIWWCCKLFAVALLHPPRKPQSPSGATPRTTLAHLLTQRHVGNGAGPWRGWPGAGAGKTFTRFSILQPRQSSGAFGTHVVCKSLPTAPNQNLVWSCIWRRRIELIDRHMTDWWYLFVILTGVRLEWNVKTATHLTVGSLPSLLKANRTTAFRWRPLPPRDVTLRHYSRPRSHIKYEKDTHLCVKFNGIHARFLAEQLWAPNATFMAL